MIPYNIIDLFDDQKEAGTETVRGHWFVRWRTINNLKENKTPTIMVKIRGKIKTAFYFRHIFSYQLQNIEHGDEILIYKNTGSPWFNSLADAEKWLNDQEGGRLGMQTTRSDQARNGCSGTSLTLT